jgi:transcriptional regulator with XRE-family HTH domain
MDIKTLVGRRIRDLRKGRGLTIERLAEIAHVGEKYLGDIERGKENPTIATLDKISRGLGVAIHQILNYEHELAGEKSFRRRINQILDTCNEADLRLFLKFAITLKE